MVGRKRQLALGKTGGGGESKNHGCRNRPIEGVRGEGGDSFSSTKKGDCPGVGKDIAGVKPPRKKKGGGSNAAEKKKGCSTPPGKGKGEPVQTTRWEKDVTMQGGFTM